MKKLIKGLHNFQEKVFHLKKDLFKELAKEQTPEVLFISCSDSRINPHLVTSAEPGDLFILRNAGNIVPPYTNKGGGEQATIEFAVKSLKVQHIILCGHSHCGAIQATINLKQIQTMPSLTKWVKKYIKPTLKFVLENYQTKDFKALVDLLTQENVLKQIENLKTHPAVAEKLAQNKLSIHAWVYEFETGDIYSYNSVKGQFEKLIKKN